MVCKEVLCLKTHYIETMIVKSLDSQIGTQISRCISSTIWQPNGTIGI